MKRISTFYIILFITGFANTVTAQQAAMYSQYMFNTLAINPAYAGSRNTVSATTLFRSQWVGMPGSPKTGTFTIDAPLNKQKFGIGIQIFSDKLGESQTTGAVLSYAYRIKMEEATLAFGIQGSANQFKADYTSVLLDPSGIQNDWAFSTDVNKTLLNAGTGVYYYSEKFYVGLSSPEIINNKLSDVSPTSDSVGVPRQSLHLFLASGYVFPLGTDFKIKPSALLKGVKGAPIQLDLSTTLWIKDVIAIGAQYRSSADISALLELQVKPQFRIGYAYDHSITRLKSFNSGSHEIMLRYEFGLERGKILSPRYF